LQNPPVTVLGTAISEVQTYTFRGWDWGRQYYLELPVDQVMHFKTGRSQTSMAFGRTPLEACRAELALVKLVSIYETTILSRAGVPSWLVSLLSPVASAMSDDQINKLKYDIKNSISGKRITSPLVYPGGELKITTPGFSPKDLSVQELAEMAVARICGVIGWAPMSLKQPDSGKTYSNLIEANKASWRDAVIPFLDLIASTLSRAVRTMPFAYGDMTAAPDVNLSVRFNVEQIEELAADAKLLADRLIGLVNAGIISKNEARADLGMEEDETLDTLGEQAEDVAEGGSGGAEEMGSEAGDAD
jgi:phage portal protein BeeE